MAIREGGRLTCCFSIKNILLHIRDLALYCPHCTHVHCIALRVKYDLLAYCVSLVPHVDMMKTVLSASPPLALSCCNKKNELRLLNQKKKKMDPATTYCSYRYYPRQYSRYGYVRTEIVSCFFV